MYCSHSWYIHIIINCKQVHLSWIWIRIYLEKRNFLNVIETHKPTLGHIFLSNHYRYLYVCCGVVNFIAHINHREKLCKCVILPSNSRKSKNKGGEDNDYESKIRVRCPEAVFKVQVHTLYARRYVSCYSCQLSPVKQLPCTCLVKIHDFQTLFVHL